MITAILIILIVSQIVSIGLIITIGKNQETNHRINYKTQDGMWDDITQIRRTVKAIQLYLADDEDDLPGLM